MLQRSQAGFTLVETTIALAISAGLAVLAFSGFNTLQKQLQFSAAVEGAKDFITQQRTEINATIQTSDTDGSPRGSSDQKVAFGRLMTATTTGFKVETLRMDVDPAPGDDATVEAVTNDTNTIDYRLQWGVMFPSGTADRQIAFVRSPLDGSLQTYVSSTAGFQKRNGNYRFGDFRNLATGSAQVFAMRSEGGKSARIVIDPKSNAISRQFD